MSWHGFAEGRATHIHALITVVPTAPCSTPSDVCDFVLCVGLLVVGCTAAQHFFLVDSSSPGSSIWFLTSPGFSYGTESKVPVKHYFQFKHKHSDSFTVDGAVTVLWRLNSLVQFSFQNEYFDFYILFMYIHMRLHAHREMVPALIVLALIAFTNYLLIFFSCRGLSAHGSWLSQHHPKDLWCIRVLVCKTLFNYNWFIIFI